MIVSRKTSGQQSSMFTSNATPKMISCLPNYTGDINESDSIEDELSQIRSQLDRIERAITASSPVNRHSNVGQISEAVASPWSRHGGGSNVSASPGVLDARGFPYMKLQTSAFTKLAGLGEDYGNLVLRLERTAPLIPTPTSGLFVLKYPKVMAALQSFSAKIHPWYPILESRFSECISSFLANSFERGTDTFLVLMVLASGCIAQEATHAEALEHRPDAMYLKAALDMMQLVVLEQSLRSVQCLAAASIHYYLLLKPLQAHDLAVIAIKKAQDLHLSGAFQDDQAAYEHWIRVYRIVLLIEGELVIPLRLVDSNAWETEEEIALPTGTDIWSFEHDTAISPAETVETSKGSRSDIMVTYLLAEISMRRILRRNTAAITFSIDGTIEYAPVIAQELEVQLERWYSYLPESLRFSPEPDDDRADASEPIDFLRTQYWACMVSFYWPAVVQVMDSQQLSERTINGCRNYFHSYRQFIKSASRALGICLPNKWTIYAR